METKEISNIYEPPQLDLILEIKKLKVENNLLRTILEQILGIDLVPKLNNGFI